MASIVRGTGDRRERRSFSAVIVGGGQSGLAMAHTLRQAGGRPVVLEAGSRPVGSWPTYYDGLTLFTPNAVNGLPGMAFPGRPDALPGRDDVVRYLDHYAAAMDIDVRTDHRVTRVRRDPEGFRVRTDDGVELYGRSVIAATGGSGSLPHRPEIPALRNFTGTVLHSVEYRSPAAFGGQRVVVVGSGNSAIQIAQELLDHADVTMASRRPVKIWPGSESGLGTGFWRVFQAMSRVPLGHFARHTPKTAGIPNVGGLREDVESGRLERRPMFTQAEGHEIQWSDGTREHVDTVILATGFRPNLGYLDGIGALRPDGWPLQRNGLSSALPGLAYVGLEEQRGWPTALFTAAYDARHLAVRLPRVLRDAGRPLSPATRD
ncbi:NAD(P)/FAD-dependent oxidoreductase [Spiractinospora alimapuensis]|uniref:flavin-containing monooxygenase n=1 Tax=Spiractinospora alimapuensis TaxID=2820884 RepID=UPI001F485392|nr:NAD(P)/FAD-dependent oxidoreductase [Spiractinospora alimapuensis]QVQ51243.1 NAD(P)/FAD-dependent oxidoreductase [Spiractinospora alimapuensis]